MAPQVEHPRATALQRRSQRLLLRVPIEVRRILPNGQAATENTFTLAVNAHGALILLAPPVSDREQLAIKNVRTQEEHRCRVVYVGPLESGKNQVGIEFITPAPQAWGIVFPPEDWTDPEAPTPKR